MPQNYQLKGNPITHSSTIGNLIYDELGKEVISKLNERFKGVKNIEYNYKHKPDEPISYSNVPRILAINNILRKITDGQIRVLSPEDVVRYWNSIPDKNHTDADTDSIIIYPTEGVNESLRQKVLSLTEKDCSNLPLIVSGLDVERVNNRYGFTFKGTNYMKATEAPFLKKDGKVAYDLSKKELVSVEDGIDVLWTPRDQSGLIRIYRRDSGLSAGSAYLSDVFDAGLVQLINNFEKDQREEDILRGK